MKYGTENEVRIPDVEVLIQAAQSDVAVVAFYLPSNPHDECEIAATLVDWDAVGAVRAVLAQAVRALNSQGWVSLDELDTRTDEDETAPPF